VVVIDAISRIEEAPLGSDSAIPHKFTSSFGWTPMVLYVLWNRWKSLRENLNNNAESILGKIIQSGNDDLLEWMLRYLPIDLSSKVEAKQAPHSGQDQEVPIC